MSYARTLALALAALLLAAAAALGASYTLGPRDVLSVTVQGLDKPQFEARIGDDGTVSLPLVGSVMAASLTVEQLEAKLVEAYGVYVRNAQVQVFVKEYHSKEISVLGQVARPGLYKLTGDTTLLEILSVVGGLAEDHADHLVVLRQEEGRDEPVNIVVDTRKLFTPGGQGLNIALHDGDVVHVPKVERETATFYIIGEVNKPGPYQIPSVGTLTVIKAVTLAGGFTDKASKGRIKIKREVGDKIMEFKVDMDTQVRPQDVVMVPESFF